MRGGQVMTVEGHQAAVVVTGVSSGIGRAIAEDLLASGYKVFGSVRRPDDAEALEARWPTAFVPLVFDVTDPASLGEAVTQVTAALGGQGLSALINNAGISHSGPILDQPMDEIRQIFEVNIFGLLATTRAFAPLLGAGTAHADKPGRIINIGSVSGAITVPFMGAYSASKHAVEAISQAVRRELKPFGIEVTTIEPGFIRTAMFDKSSPATAGARYAHTPLGAAWQQFNASLLEQERTAKPTTVVTRAVRAALDDAKPRTRHPLNPLWRIGRLLPDRAFDPLIFKALGLTALMRPR